jgi:hypothetical protein
MRSYGKIAPQFWIGSTGRKLRKAGPEALLVALYLITSPSGTMLGLYYLPRPHIAHETGLGMEGAMQGLGRAIEAGFCDYDEASEVVFVFEMARFQIGEQLEPTDKRCAGVQRQYDELPENRFLADFYRRYAKPFHMTHGRGQPRRIEGPCEVPGSQEQEQEQEQKQEQPEEQEPKPAGRDQAVEEIWNYYVARVKKNLSLYQFTPQRRTKGRARLEECLRMAAEPKLDNAVAMMKVCIDRLAASAFHNGDNREAKKYLDWDHLFRNHEKLVRWLDDDNHSGRSHR